MADAFRLSGSYSTTPTSGTPSGDPEVEALIEESVGLTSKTIGVYALTVDTPVTVDFGGLTNANVIAIRAVGGKVKARLTSADGSTQAVPVDPLLLSISKTVPVTAIDLTRVAGVATTVRVFLGERAT